MKAILEFTLPEDQNEFETCSNAKHVLIALWDFRQDMRQWLKHGHEFKNADDALEKINDAFYEHFNELKIDLN
jgi:hypothetical protein